MRSLIFTAAVLASTAAFGATFGANRGCGYGAADWQYPDTDAWSFFDGSVLEAHETSCELTSQGSDQYDGACSAEGMEFAVAFTAVEKGDTLIVSSADYGDWILQRCQ